MARVIQQQDPFVQQIPETAYGGGDWRRGFDRFNTYLDTAEKVIRSPVTGLLLRGGQAVAGAISDSLADAAKNRLGEYTAKRGDLTLDQGLSSPEPYKPMPGLSLRGDQPSGLGLSLDRGEPAAEPGKRDVSSMGILPAFSAPPAGMDTSGDDERVAAVFGDKQLAEAAKNRLARQSVLSKGILPAFTSPRVPGLEIDKDAAILDTEPTMPAGPALPQVPRLQRGAALPTAEQLGEARRNPPMTLRSAEPTGREIDLGETVVYGKRPPLTLRGAEPAGREFDLGETVVYGRRPPELTEAGRRVLADRAAAGLNLSNAEANQAGATGMFPAPRGETPALPQVSRTRPGQPLPTADALSEARRNPPLTLDAGQQEQNLDDEWRRFLDDESGDEKRLNLDERLGFDAALPNIPSARGNLDQMVAEGAPMMGRSGRLSQATDAQLQALRDELGAADDQTSRERLADVEGEITAREDRGTIANRALTPDEMFARARAAGTVEEQQQILRDVGRVRLPITSVQDLIGDDRERRFRQELVGMFPTAPKKSEEERLADVEAKLALADYRRRGADWRAALGGDIAAKTGAGVGKLEAEAAAAAARGRASDASAGLSDERARDLAQTRDPRNRKMLAEADRLGAATDKLRADIARIKAGGRGRGGGGGGNLKQDLAMLRAGIQAQGAIVKTSNEMISEGMRAARDASDKASAAELRLSMVPDAGDEPMRPDQLPSNMPDAARSAAIRAHAEWQKRAGARRQAVLDVELARSAAREANATIKQLVAEQQRAADVAKEYDVMIGAVRRRIEKKLGVAPTAPAAPAAQQGGGILDAVGNFISGAMKQPSKVKW